ncbi:MAG TPA: hypothetical protein VIV63_12590 [Steroidobacteraceae bacterium]
MTAVLFGIAGATVAQEGRNPLNATAVVDMGGFFLSTDIQVRLDGEGGRVGDTIDFDDTFGLDRFERFRVDGLWRIKGKHSIRGTYFKNNRSSTNELDRDINFGDETYPVGATTTARWELEVMQLSYDYAFKRTDKYELAAGIGVHVLDARLALDATVTGAGGSFSTELSESGSTDAPLPVLGLRGIWALPHNFYFTAQAQYFYVDYNEYNGSLSDLKATIVWQATPRFGVGLGYNDFRFRFDLEKNLFSGRLRWNYGGAMAFASVTF